MPFVLCFVQIIDALLVIYYSYVKLRKGREQHCKIPCTTCVPRGDRKNALLLRGFKLRHNTHLPLLLNTYEDTSS